MGWAGVLLGILLIIWSVVFFTRHDTPIHPGKPPKLLLRSGPYKINRNPIYSGFIIITVGVGMLQGSLLGLVPGLVLFWALDRYFAAPEEAVLIASFGAEAENYVSAVRRW